MVSCRPPRAWECTSKSRTRRTKWFYPGYVSSPRYVSYRRGAWCKLIWCTRCRCTALRAEYRSFRIHRVNMKSVCTRTQRNGLVARNWYVQVFLKLEIVWGGTPTNLFVYLQRVHFDIQVGEQAIDYAQVAQKEKLSELQIRVRQLLDQVDQIVKEQNYQRVSCGYRSIFVRCHEFVDVSNVSLSFQYREERFRATSESTNQRVFWWSISQLVILVSMGLWQMRHLKSFFEAKKLV